MSNPFGDTFGALRRKLSSSDRNREASESSKTAEAQRESNASLSPAYSPTRRPSTSNNPFMAAPSGSSNPDAPPPYSEAPVVSNAEQSTASASQGEGDPFHFLRTFDTVFLIDDSGSMAGSRWRETRDALKTITPICTSYDADGVDIYFLNSTDTPDNRNVTSAARVEQIFDRVRPRGATPTGQRLEAILKPYLLKYEKASKNAKPKAMNLICITDGAPSDDVEGPLVQAARRLDKMDAPSWQVGVQFFQVGRDEQARKHLQSLDDDLESAAGKVELRDMVDTVPFQDDAGSRLTADGILKVVLGGVNRRQDRKNKDLHGRRA